MTNFDAKRREVNRLVENGHYPQAVIAAGSLLETLLSSLYNDAFPRLPPDAQQEVGEKVQAIGRGKAASAFTAGQRVGLSREALDKAFTRRLSMRVSFPKPAEAERARLWRSMIAGRGPLCDGIDFQKLADEFDLSGGHIRNAVLRAAFLAASRDRRIDQRLLHISARIEMKEQGMLVHGNPLLELHEEGSP